MSSWPASTFFRMVRWMLSTWGTGSVSMGTASSRSVQKICMASHRSTSRHPSWAHSSSLSNCFSLGLGSNSEAPGK